MTLAARYRPGRGLSPLARGTLIQSRNRLKIMRFIPAGAGNSQHWNSRKTGRAVYPRWRGELLTLAARYRPGRGLSPLARGTLIQSRNRLKIMRFIPAGAGNSQHWNSRKTGRAVYPRWRGELRQVTTQATESSGLSPLARGTRLTILVRNNQRRFIPAGAGNSLRLFAIARFLPVYPRWRGELRKLASYNPQPSGLSPLARGTPIPRSCRWTENRFIPAGAGNS